jgi:nicotinate phosphoribosyltransferase
MGVSADAPSLDSAYKLVEYDGRPMLKLSEAKATEPGRKQVFRGPDDDVVGLRDEPLPQGREPLLVPVMRGGRRTGPTRTLETARTLFRSDLDRVPEAARRIEDPVAQVPSNSVALERLSEQATAEALRRAGLPQP